MLVKGKIAINGPGDDAAAQEADERNKRAIFKNCALFTDCISEINNTQIDNAKDLGGVISMYNLIEYSDHCLKTSGLLWKYYRDVPHATLRDLDHLNLK